MNNSSSIQVKPVCPEQDRTGYVPLPPPGM
jgi:hypothetical protein